MIRAGKLDRRISILERNVSQNATGEEIIVWNPIATVWAEKVEAKGAERFAATQFIGHAVKTFRFRWSSQVEDVSTLHRISFDGREFDVTDVREVGRRQGIEVDCYARSEDPMDA